MDVDMKFIWDLQETPLIDSHGNKGVIAGRTEMLNEDGDRENLYFILGPNGEELQIPEKELKKFNSTSRCRHVWGKADDEKYNQCLKCPKRKLIGEVN